MPATYDFATQLEIGQRAENAIAALLKHLYRVRKAGRRSQNQGVDYHCTHKRTGQQLKIEVKADLKAHIYRNGFIEIPSDESRGWSATCSADLLLYFCPGLGRIYLFRPCDLRDRIDGWQQLYRVKPAQNGSYQTWGICVPLSVLEGVAIAVATVKVKGLDFHN